MRWLFLGSNKFEHIPRFTQLAPNLKKYILADNLLNSQNADAVDLTYRPTIFGVYLSNNQHTDIPQFIGAGAISLDTLHMQNCQIEFISKARFVPLTNLKVLHIAGNPLLVIPDIEPLVNLRELYIYRSAISKVSLEEINGMPETQQTMDIAPGAGYVSPYSSPNLTTIPNMCGLRSGITVEFYGLPLHCDCKMRWTTKIALASGVDITLASEPCHSPPGLVGRTLDDISMDEMVCDGK